MKKFLCSCVLLAGLHGMVQAAEDTYDPASGLLTLPQVNVSGKGEFCDLQLNLKGDGAWTLLAANACTPQQPSVDQFAFATEELILPRLSVAGMGAFCSLRVRLGSDGHWEVLSFIQCSDIPDIPY